jgi:hypothetical protein
MNSDVIQSLDIFLSCKKCVDTNLFSTNKSEAENKATKAKRQRLQRHKKEASQSEAHENATAHGPRQNDNQGPASKITACAASLEILRTTRSQEFWCT